MTCEYPQERDTPELLFCKEENVTCEEILSSSMKTKGAFALEETGGKFNVVIGNASPGDNGVYWCAARRQSQRAGFQKIILEVRDGGSSTTESPGIRHQQMIIYYIYNYG